MFCTLHVCSLLLSLFCRCSADDSETKNSKQILIKIPWMFNYIQITKKIFKFSLGNWCSRSGWFSLHWDANKCLWDVDVLRPPVVPEYASKKRKKKLGLVKTCNKNFTPVFIYQVSHFPRPCHVAFAIGHASECQSHYVWVGWTCLNPPKQEK